VAIFRYFELIRYQVYANLRAETARGGLGILWWAIEPLLFMGVFYFFFKFVLGRGGDDTIPFLIVGLTVWKWFASSVLQGAQSIQAGAGLMRQVYLSKCVFPIVTVLTGTFKFLIVFCLLLVFLLILGFNFTLSWISLPFLIVTQLLLILFIASFFSAIIPFFIDLKHVLDNLMILLMFLSGTFYDIQATSGKINFLLNLNPMAKIIIEYRSVLIGGRWPDGDILFLISIISLLGLGVNFLIIRKLERTYPKIII